jgi:TRAP-type C4-dicarboxylate transport system permease small subunit|tara:strand:+ start:1875 stop:2390 length:516 start_codon:yes stop_codon:yes gene_type:complete
MESFDKGVERVTTALAYLACAVIPCMFTLIVVDVSMRTVGINPPLFTSSLVEYALLYVAMFSAPWLVRQKGHVAIEAVLTICSPFVQRVFAFIVYLTCTTASLLFAWFSWQLFMEAVEGGQLDVRGVDLPYWAQFLPMFIGFSLVTLELFFFLIGRRHYYSYDLGEVKDTV